MNIRKIPIFKNRPAFLLFTLVVGGTGYYGYSFLNDWRFNNPLIDESIRLIQKNNQVIQLAGYPLAYKSSTRSNIIQKEGTSHYTFQVEGPKGGVYVELIGRKKKLADIEQDELGTFYIPTKKLIDYLVENKDKTEELKNTMIDPNETFQSIDQLAVDVGKMSDMRISIKEGNKILKISEDQSQQIQQIQQRKNMFDLWRELESRMNTQAHTEGESEEIRQYKQQMFYRKIGNVRIAMVGIFILGGMAIYNYTSRNKRIRINNSQLHLQSLAFVKQNSFSRQLFGQQMQFSQYIRGGAIDNEAEFETDIFSQKMDKKGIVSVKGKKDEETNEWKIESIEVSLKNKDGSVNQNKKIW